MCLPTCNAYSNLSFCEFSLESSFFKKLCVRKSNLHLNTVCIDTLAASGDKSVVVKGNPYILWSNILLFGQLRYRPGLIKHSCIEFDSTLENWPIRKAKISQVTYLIQILRWIVSTGLGHGLHGEVVSCSKKSWSVRFHFILFMHCFFSFMSLKYNAPRPSIFLCLRTIHDHSYRQGSKDWNSDFLNPKEFVFDVTHYKCNPKSILMKEWNFMHSMFYIYLRTQDIESQKLLVRSMRL